MATFTNLIARCFLLLDTFSHLKINFHHNLNPFFLPMGMICTLRRVSQADLDAYLSDSSLLESRISSDYDEEPGDDLLFIDKAWDGILFLLTGEGIGGGSHPLYKLIFTTQFIDEEQDLGYGPAHYSTPEQVAKLSAQLAPITIEDLKPRYAPTQMIHIDIYPDIWESYSDEGFEYLCSYFIELQAFYAEAAKNREAIITILS